MTESTEDTDGGPRIQIALIAAALIIVAQVAVGFAVYYALPDWPTRGQFGDVFGAANALFSGLAFAGLIYTVFLQREELALQRKELQLTREELKRSADAQEASMASMNAQADAAHRSASLATINFLLAHYQAELRPMLGQVMMDIDPRRRRLDDLLERQSHLLGKVEAMYVEILNEGNVNGGA